MSSLSQGYAFDIFVSYRHKDNKYDGWVTEFVNNLKKELESTFKEQISIYFDANPEDGLHETHDVDDSLKDKVRSLIFIPIVSRTYCDENSFAWRKEFLGFRDFAIHDPLGMKVKLANGNVTSRVLPIRIHDLDAEDVQLFEKELSSSLRSIDFIFKSSGVNRPLRPQDDERKDNLNHTYYRDQINKVAMAIREIVGATKLARGQTKEVSAIRNPPAIRVHPKPRKFIVPALIIVLLGIIGYGAIYIKDKVPVANSTEEVHIDRSIAVLPFTNMSPDKDQEYFSDGLSEEVLNVLAQVPDMKVISRTSAFAFKGKNEDIRTIGQKLGVAYLLEGSVRKSADQLRISAQLIKASDGTHIWSETFDRSIKDIFKVQDEIARAVVSSLKLRLLSTSHAPKESKPEVYSLWMRSRFYALSHTGQNKAFEFAQQALALDSTDARVWAQLARCYHQSVNLYTDYQKVAELLETGLKAANKAIELDPNLADGYAAMSRIRDAKGEITEAAKYSMEAVKRDSSSQSLSELGIVLTNLGEFEKGKILLKKAASIDPLYPRCYTNLAAISLVEGDTQQAIEYANTAIELKFNDGYFYLAMAKMQINLGKEALEAARMIEDEFWRNYYTVLALWTNRQKTESKAALSKFESEYKEVGSFQIAEIYGWYGEYDNAFEWLDLAFKYRDPGLMEIKQSLIFQKLQNDPRYKATLEKLKIPV